MTIIQGYDLDTTCIASSIDAKDASVALTIVVEPGKAKIIKVKVEDADYAAAFAWADGRTTYVTPPVGPPIVSTVSPKPRVIRTIRVWMDQVVQQRKDAAGLFLYAGINDAILCGVKKDADALIPWAAACWKVGFKVVDDVVAGRRSTPTDAQLILELPAMVWPL